MLYDALPDQTNVLYACSRGTPCASAQFEASLVLHVFVRQVLVRTTPSTQATPKKDLIIYFGELSVFLTSCQSWLVYQVIEIVI